MAARVGSRLSFSWSLFARSLAGSSLPHVKSPTLLIVGGDDTTVIELNEQAQEQMRTECKIVIVPGASHVFEEPDKLEEVARLATDWFLRYLTKEVRDGHTDNIYL